MLVQIAGSQIGQRDGEDVHIVDTAAGCFAFVVDGSRLYAIDRQSAHRLRKLRSDDALAEIGIQPRVANLNQAPSPIPVRSLSLAVAQKCNLGCTYCYAQEGSFGAEPMNMSRDVALSSVRLLFHNLPPGETVTLAFLGGEPLVNRALLRECTELASELGSASNATVNFSITTNGTLLSRDDADFFERFGFAVTVSLDGIGRVHDQQRSFRSGAGSFARIIENVEPLLRVQRRMQVSARVTVTPKNLELRRTLDELLALDFHSVGFSPMLHAPSGSGEMDGENLQEMLGQMIACGEEFERRVVCGERYGFSNLATAIREIHKGTHRPYPCGAGGGYFGVSAEGGLYACHRFVQDESARFGDVNTGVDPLAQSAWLKSRHVDSQIPCSACWARYLCGGSCHHEAIYRGRPACEYIRGWLDYSIKAYVRLRAVAPEYFES